MYNFDINSVEVSSDENNIYKSIAKTTCKIYLQPCLVYTIYYTKTLLTYTTFSQNQRLNYETPFLVR